MDNFGLIFGLAIVLAIFIVGYYIKTANYFKWQRQEIEKRKSGIEIALTNRYDALNKLNKTVCGYTGHESKVLTEVTKIRKGMGTEQLGDAEGQMNAAYSNLMAMVENYPELKANTSFMHIQEAICDIENTIQATRRSFNQAVSEYNTRIEIIPSCYVAKKLNIRVENYFEADEIKKEDIELKY